MKLENLIATTVMAASLTFMSACGQDMTTVDAASTDISDNLDLRAVATVFGNSENLEDFERRLNDPDLQLSNLDLNQDGYVDYLRVIEVSEKGTHVVLIQAVIGEDLYQDVATIDVERDDSGETSVQVVGDVYMYGPDYVIEPYYSSPPVIYVYLWGPYYDPWYSPYYWGYYPRYYHPWRPVPVPVYTEHVHTHINTSTTYTYVGHRGSSMASTLERPHSEAGYRKMRTSRSFAKRNNGMKNKLELTGQREKMRINRQGENAQPKDGVKSSGRRVQPDWEPGKGKAVPNDGKIMPNNQQQGNKNPVRIPNDGKLQQPDQTGRPSQQKIDPFAPVQGTKPNIRNDRPSRKHDMQMERPAQRPAMPDRTNPQNKLEMRSTPAPQNKLELQNRNQPKKLDP